MRARTALYSVGIAVLALSIVWNLRQRWLKESLWSALERGDATTIHRLLEQGASPDSKGGDGVPFSIALVQKKRFDLAKSAAQRQKQIETRDNRGNTLLMAVAYAGAFEVVQAVLKRGANPETQNKMGATPLMLAMTQKDIRIVDALLEKNASVNMRDLQGNSALYYAIQANNVEGTLRLLARSADDKQRNRLNASLLHTAASNSNCFLIRLLLQRGANVNLRDFDGTTPLLRALMSGRTVEGERAQRRQPPFSLSHVAFPHDSVNDSTLTVRLLLAKGADPNIPDNSGRTPLYFGVYSAQIVSDLLKHGAEVSPKNSLRPLYAFANAVQYSNPVVIEQFMKRSREMRQVELDAALEKAVYTRNEALAKRLGQKNARIRGRSTALWLAAVQGDAVLMEKLTAYGAKPMQGEWNVMMRLSFSRKSVRTLEQALKHGADPNIRYGEESTPLMRAVVWGEPQAVSLLLRYGAKTDPVNEEGQTAQALAQSRGDAKIVSLLNTPLK